MNQPESMHPAPETSPAGPEPSLIEDEQPYLPPEGKQESSRGGNRRLAAIGFGVALLILVMVFSALSHQSHNGARDRRAKRPASRVSTASESERRSLSPIVEARPAPLEQQPANLVDAEQVARSATGRRDLYAGIRFAPPSSSDDHRSLQSPNYTEFNEGSAASSRVPERDMSQKRNEAGRDSFGPSLVFTAKQAPVSVSIPAASQAEVEVDLPAGTKLRARLEAAVNTAVHTPVVAIVEYNYEQNGEIAIPAGARVTGHLGGAARSGYVEIRFDSLSIPGTAPRRMEAIATDLGLRPLRGRVEGKNTGKNLFVRSAAGIGQIAATLAGRGNLDQPLSESDLVRERLSNNIGQAADQQVARLALSEQTVVSLPAGTELYVVLEKLALDKTHPGQAPLAVGNQRNVDELRQLIELQREFGQSTLAAAQ